MRGQVSLEFIIIFSIAVLVMATIFVVGSSMLTDAADEKHLRELNDIALTAQQELITAVSVHDGYTRSFYLPETIVNEAYSFSVQNTTRVAVLTIEWNGLQRSVRVPLHNGTLKPGKNTVVKNATGMRVN